MDLITHWLGVREQERGPNRTLTEYRLELRRFDAFLGSTPIRDASKSQVREYLEGRYKGGASPATRRRTLAAIRSFYTFLVGEEVVLRNPTDGIKAPKVPDRLTNTLRPEQVGFLILNQKVHEGKKADFFNKRNRALVQLAFSAGLRRAELASIRMDAIDFAQRSINVIGKGDKERVVFFDLLTLDTLNDYLADKPESSFLFCTVKGTQLSLRQVWVIIKTAFDRAGIKGTPHTLRHSFGTYMYRQGADIHSVQRLLGHTNISTTQLYVHLDRDDLKAMYDRVTDHPV